jgi:hypothetical protein
MEIVKTIINEVEKFNESIKDALDSKNISNTGEAARSLYVDWGENWVKSIGIFYLEFLDTGRGPGKPPPIDPLIRWAQNKFGVDEVEAKSIAFAVAKKIAYLGTEIFMNKGQGIELAKKIITLRENLNDVVKESAKFQIKEKLNEFKLKFTKLKFGL